MLKTLLFTVLLSLSTFIYAKPVGITVLPNGTRVVVTDDACKHNLITNFTKTVIFVDKEDTVSSGCYGMLFINDDLGYAVMIYSDATKEVNVISFSTFVPFPDSKEKSEQPKRPSTIF